MTNLERKRLQWELEALRGRKAKADSLGPQVIAKQQALYGAICADIRRHEDALAAADGGLARAVLDLIPTLLRMGWAPGDFQAGLAYPGRPAALRTLEDGLVAAFNLGDAERFETNLAAYRAALDKIHADAKRAGEQIHFTEVQYDDCPWA